MPFRLRRAVYALMSVVLASCGGKWATIREGAWQGHRYIVEERSSSGLFASTNSLDWRITVGALPAVPINANTTDWGPPYSTDIYGTDAYSFIASRDTTYVDTPFSPGTIGVAHTMLYISPSTLSEEEYKTFCHFMLEEWPRLSDSLTGRDLREFPHLIGLVYGTRTKYVRDYRGTHEGKPMIVRIEPDGRVRFIEDNKWAAESYSGLAEKVHMPGKILRLRTAAGSLSVDDLRGFRDARDVPVEVGFEIVQVPETSGR